MKVLGAGLVALLLGGCASIHRAPTLDLSSIEGTTEDVLLGPTEPLPATAAGRLVLVGDLRHVDALCRRRSEAATQGAEVVLLIDLHGADPRLAEECVDRLVLDALDPGGPVLVERDGRWAAHASGALPLPVAVVFDQEGRVLERTGSDQGAGSELEAAR